MTENAAMDSGIGRAFDEVEVVLIDERVFRPFLEHAIEEYRKGRESIASADLPLHRPNSFGILGGSLEDDDAMVVKQFAFAGNVRAVDPVPAEEFRENIVPRFGPQYDHGDRGYWCDSRDLLKIMREFDEAGLEMLGSIHMHPDWHRMGPAHERGAQKLSEKPSRMDEYLFLNTGWPLNIICYLEGRGGGIAHTYGAWRPPSYGAPSAGVDELTIRFFLDRDNPPRPRRGGDGGSAGWGQP